MIELRNLHVNYKIRAGYVKAVRDVSLRVKNGETYGLVGESGCGKSTLGQALLKILPSQTEISGNILIDNTDIANYTEKEMQKIRGVKISMIFQDPMTSLNPIMKVKDIFIETIQTHYPEISKEEAYEQSAKALESVGIARSRLEEYPFQFSGGMRQRVMIALSTVLNPTAVVADEPTTSLDVIVQAQILDLLHELQKTHNMAMILITHDLGVVAQNVDNIGVMYGGMLMEESNKYNIYDSPKHPYTQALLSSIPNTDLNDLELSYIEGYPPNLLHPPKGCPFAPRCPKAKQICKEKLPPFIDLGDTKVRCWLYGGDTNE